MTRSNSALNHRKMLTGDIWVFVQVLIPLTAAQLRSFRPCWRRITTQKKSGYIVSAALSVKNRVGHGVVNASFPIMFIRSSRTLAQYKPIVKSTSTRRRGRCGRASYASSRWEAISLALRWPGTRRSSNGTGSCHTQTSWQSSLIVFDANSTETQIKTFIMEQRRKWEDSFQEFSLRIMQHADHANPSGMHSTVICQVKSVHLSSPFKKWRG